MIRYHLSTEKNIRLLESENKLVFVVDRSDTKAHIAKALKELFNAHVVSVNTVNDAKGRKKAYVKFGPDTPALDIATKLGLM